MIRSMTGFGKAECHANNRKLSLEIRCLNSKQLDISTRIPSSYREYEHEMRSEISRKLVRGKVDLILSVEALEGDSFHQLNTPLIKKYYDDILALAKEMDIEICRDPMALLLQLPDVFKSGREVIDEQEWAIIKQGLAEALGATDAFRLSEGKSIEEDLVTRVHLIQDFLRKIEPHEQGRLMAIRQKMLKSIEEALQGNLPDQNRFEQEMIFYMERLDITEEKTRLTKHCHHFLETLEQEEPSGKKLGFIAQEMGREINTLGSKANDSDIQRWVVLMKDELEKIKEQLFNVL